MLGREKDCVIFYLEAQSGKSKRKNRENNEHLEPKTFTPNKKTKEKIQIVNIRYDIHAFCHQ